VTIALQEQLFFMQFITLCLPSENLKEKDKFVGLGVGGKIKLK
jgi:hypothetical protein